MNLAISICEHERAMALQWFSWVADLGQTSEHSLFLLPAAGIDAQEVIEAAQKAFPDAVTVLRDAEAIKSDWQGPDAARSAAGPNSAFRQFGWYFYYAKVGPWFWIELDAIPLKAGWIDALESEYRAVGKPFLGAHVIIEKVPTHLSGNAIYPENVPALAPSLVMRTNWINDGKEYELAFDIAGAKEVLPQAHFTNLIQHKFRHPGFKTREEFEATIDPNAVVFHSNKTGDIYPLLREKVFGISPLLRPLCQPIINENGMLRKEFHATTESASAATIPVPGVRGPDGINDGECLLEGCSKAAHARGVCRMHYARFEKHNSFDLLPKPTLEERLMFGRMVVDNGCWLWTEAVNKAGYGQIYINSRIPQNVHRVSYEHFIAPVPNDIYVCHKCDVKPCFNPEHLFLGTAAENMQDAARKGRLGKTKGKKMPKKTITPELLKKLRANMAKARAVQAAKRTAR